MEEGSALYIEQAKIDEISLAKELLPPGVEYFDGAREVYKARYQYLDSLLLKEEQNTYTAEDFARFQGWLDMMNRFAVYMQSVGQEFGGHILHNRPGQVPVMESLYWFMEEHGFDNPKGYVSIPTGGGKTVMFAELAKALGVKTLIVVPTHELLEQTVTTFQQHSQETLDIGEVSGRCKHVSDFATVTTYASYVKQSKDPNSLLYNPDQFELVILDEGHHALAEQTSRVVKSHSKSAIIGFTASEDYSETRQLKNLLPVEIHKMSTAEAVKLGLITPFQVVAVKTEVDMSSVRVVGNRYSDNDLERIVNTDLINNIVLELYQKYYLGKKVVVFCAGVKHAIHLSTLFQEHGLSAEAYYGKLERKRRRDLVELSKLPGSQGGIDVLFNDKLLTEGFDNKGIYAIFNLVPILSWVRALQRGGRGLRLYEEDLDKVAQIVEFLGFNYDMCPVLFAEDSVAGTAAIAPEGVRLPEINWQLNNATVISDPNQVKELADEFADMRRSQRAKAPEGSFTLDGMSRELDISQALLKRAVTKLQTAEPDFAAEHITKIATSKNSRRKVTYYSVELMSRVKSYVEFPAIAPKGWIALPRVCALYGVNEQRARSILRGVKEVYPKGWGEFVEKKGMARIRQFFSPEAVEAFAEAVGQDFVMLGDKAPHLWLPKSDLYDVYGEATGEFIQDLFYRERTMAANHSGKFLNVDGQLVDHYSPLFIEKMGQHKYRPPGWVDSAEMAKIANVSVEEVEAIANEYRKDDPSLYRHYSRYAAAGDNWVRFFSLTFQAIINRYLERGFRVQRLEDNLTKEVKTLLAKHTAGSSGSSKESGQSHLGTNGSGNSSISKRSKKPARREGASELLSMTDLLNANKHLLSPHLQVLLRD